jgi:hypothetical protein
MLKEKYLKSPNFAGVSVRKFGGLIGASKTDYLN